MVMQRDLEGDRDVGELREIQQDLRFKITKLEENLDALYEAHTKLKHKHSKVKTNLKNVERLYTSILYRGQAEYNRIRASNGSRDIRKIRASLGLSPYCPVEDIVKTIKIRESSSDDR